MVTTPRLTCLHLAWLFDQQTRLYLSSASLIVEDRSDVPATSALSVQANISSCVAPAAIGIEPQMITWSFCYQESQTLGDAAGYGPFTVSYVGQLTTLNHTSASPASGQLGYLLTSARGYRVQLNKNGVLTRNYIIGLGWVVGGTTEQGYDPYIYTNGVAENKTATTPAVISSQGLLFALDNGPILPNGYQTNAAKTTAAVYEVTDPIASLHLLAPVLFHKPYHLVSPAATQSPH